MTPPNAPEEYLPAISTALESRLERTLERHTNLIGLLEAGRDISLYGRRYDTPEKRAELIQQLEEDLRNEKKGVVLSLQKHAEGFGRAALDKKDTFTALDNLDAAGVLENAEVVKALKSQISEVQKSEKVEDKVKLRKISEKLLAIKKKRQATEVQTATK